MWRVRRWKHVAFIMLEKSVRLLLWDITIIGGMIKRYSYRMVPYIVAENPDIPHREAFLLSRQMMKGNKMRAFILDVSFLGWHILNVFTFDILRHVFITPYTETTSAELYVALRQEAFERGLEGTRYLDDEKLYEESSLEDYPVESYKLYNPKVKKWIYLEYDRTYSWRSLILIFFYLFLYWLAVGSLSPSVRGRSFCESWIFSRPVASDLWNRGNPCHSASEAVCKKAACNLLSGSSGLRGSRVCVSMASMGD